MSSLLDHLKPADSDYALAASVDVDRLPAHIAIIMDGNGRWAGKRHLPRVAGHRAGVDSVRETVETCARLHVQALTLYAFSIENWKRPRTEVDMLWRLLRHYLKHELDELQRNNVRFGSIGRLEQLSDAVRRDLQDVATATAANTGLRLNLAINYGARAEIVDAVRSMVEKARRGEPVDVTEESISAHLYTAKLADPDLLIRTSGEMRVSNFLLWQIAYAELYVTETLWPDFRRADLLRAILEYQKRDRRFGGLSRSDSTSADPILEPAAASSR